MTPSIGSGQSTLKWCGFSFCPIACGSGSTADPPFFGRSLNVYNFTLGLSYFAHRTNHRARFISEPAGYQLREVQLILNESAWLQPEPVHVIRDKPRVDVIETTLEGEAWRADSYVDKRTHLPSQIIT